jgi:protein SCO1/2
VDKNKHVRGIYDGTKSEEVDHLMEDMETLLKEK